MTEVVSAFLFMAKSPFAKSQRKFIRKEKARIRREFFNLKKQEEEISKLYPHTKQGQGALGTQIGEASPRSGVGVYGKIKQATQITK